MLRAVTSFINTAWQLPPQCGKISIELHRKAAAQKAVDDLTIRDMEYIAAIAKEKSMTKAAAQLFVAQPALSQCVRKLEKELGITLFLRTVTGVCPTAEGECFLRFVEKTLAERTNFEKELVDLSQSEGGTIRLGFSGAQAAFVLPHFLTNFRVQHPSIELQLVEASSDTIEKGIEAGEIDVGILHLPIASPRLDYFELSRDRFVIIPRSCGAYEQYIYYKEGEKLPYLNIGFLKNEPLVLTQQGQRSRIACNQIFEKAGIVPQVRQEVQHIGTLDALTLVDYASTLLPEKQLTEDIKRRGYFLIDEKYSVSYAFVVCTLKDAYLSKASRQLLDRLQEIQYTF